MMKSPKIAFSTMGKPNNRADDMMTNFATLSFLTNRWSVPR